jgi:hypothetical protein
MELISLNKNTLNWQSFRPLLWLFLILATLNLSTGAIIVLVAAGPGGEVLDDASNIPASEIRLLHLELFGGIVHLHNNTLSNSSQPGSLQKAILPPELMKSFDALFPGPLSVSGDSNSNFTFQNQYALIGEKPDPTGLNISNIIITSSDSESGLSRTFSPTFKEPEKTLLLFHFDKVSHPVIYKAAAWPDILLYPPEKPPQTFSLIVSA